MTTDAIVDAVISHPQILLGVLAGVILTVVIHAIRRIRRLITTGIVLAIAGGGATGITTLQNLLHWH
ncbi:MULTISPECIES: hypothetical protein [unclassified Mycolicibacterium]|uniref:hypothetical protein n=1 Tax=unclassified Mycolicibacterium TaxID=2636767 RepID=UPI0012DD0B72|nr:MULTISPECIES: hypothetical protein [unclassified Mycolicibacterium]MUL80529.1 hypothetical protein [Mycolicibacterium sp. CBMA 329]MUL86296.1 hypothetical protein [Mycolicibacterium sp. CBMA 331]MUM01043.1 hypothetical protein [Mycolicibacterium sp. CBMA 334]MUM24939.1 hypothetical protein [Mycolicibacterium sp. CBMA 295]MUM36592.1 hypothetical protein [Mycolicibacterium sp. CBMA 247]